MTKQPSSRIAHLNQQPDGETDHLVNRHDDKVGHFHHQPKSEVDHLISRTAEWTT